jgi:AcrR family transcriptional regulator
MTSIRHNPVLEDTPILDAARENILAVGWRRTTITDVAKRAGVSRMTIYRRWPDMQTLLGDLLVREWGDLVDALTEGVTRIADGVVAVVRALRGDPLFRRVVELDPEVLLPYLLQRRGRNQDHLLQVLTSAIAAGQDTGVVRAGVPDVLARALLLAVQGFVVSSATMTDVPIEELDRELALLVERYLAP